MVDQTLQTGDPTGPAAGTGDRGVPGPPPGRAARLWRWLRPRRRWCLGTRLVVAASVSWLLFVTTHRLVSGRTWWWAPLDLIPPALLLAVPAALLLVAPLARPVRWRLMAVLVVAAGIGAGASGINPATLWHTPPPAPPEAITVVSWNTEFWDQSWRAGGDGLDAGFYRHLRTLDADVYLLMEYAYAASAGPGTPGTVRGIDRQERLREHFPDYHVTVVGKQLTISRFPVVRQRGLNMRQWLPEHLRQAPPELADYPGYLVETLRVDVRVEGTVVSFYNTHVSQPPVEPTLYRGEAREASRNLHDRRVASLRALRADVERNPHPVVVGADLNSSPAMGIRRLLPDRLVDHSAALPSVYPASWPADGLSWWRIDWLLTTPDVAVHEYELRDPAGMSDHRIQWAVLSTN